VCDQIKRYPYLPVISWQLNWQVLALVFSFFFLKGHGKKKKKNHYLIDENLHTTSSCPTYSSVGTRDCTSNNAADWYLTLIFVAKFDEPFRHD